MSRNEWTKNKFAKRKTKRHRKLNEARIALSYLSVGFIGGLTPYVFNVAEVQRGCIAAGGEVLFPCLAMLAYFGIDFIFEAIRTYTDERELENVNRNESSER